MNRNDAIDFGLVGLANLLPLVGFFLFDWELLVIGLLYWCDAVALMLVYSGYAMFAQPESRVEEREYTVLPGTVANGYWSQTPRTLSRFLPPIYTRNLRVILPTLIFVVFVILFTAGADWMAGTLESNIGSPGNPVEFLSMFSVFASPLVLGVGAVILGVHVVTLYRRYVRRGKHEELSAYMTLEPPVRFILVYLAFVPPFFLYALLVGALLNGVLPHWGVYLLWAGSFLALKLFLEWGRFRAERLPDPDSYAAWFSPSTPSETVTLSGRAALTYVVTFGILLSSFLFVVFQSSG
ncbi:DUF6498-containing protein [Halorussus sp. MSC15.2]|uniref:DUF6498-containing protein n=1 Tax=Halorussus sp. MSC15.2 TaxID=2283638 RepID=UPI0013D7E99D|nr:DUF6498-containing protein [Halorussus sp. MSC15.2]NEU58042.1 hypothetical protein [Halorussus sp. MSC15.2]